jgi:vancomycin resistance protein VanJ
LLYKSNPMSRAKRNEISEPLVKTHHRDPQPTRPRKNRFGTFLIHLLAWGYLISLVAAWALMRYQGERWWIATLMMFGPRWAFALPLLLIVPLALLRKRSLWIVAVAVMFLLFGNLNFAIPWRTWNLPASVSTHLRLMTLNNNRQTQNTGGLSRAITDANPDIVLIQEWKSAQAQTLFTTPQWHVLVEADMLLASKFPIRHVTNLYPPASGLEGAVYSYDIILPDDKIRLINIHLASPHEVFREALGGRSNGPQEVLHNCRMRLTESQLVARHANSTDMPTILAGDFNTPIDSETFRTCWAGYTDAFAFAGTGLGITYRVKKTWTRIDHIIINRDWQCRNCHLGPDVGSPHLPVIADLERVTR